MTVSEKRLGKHVSTATNMHATIVTTGNGMFPLTTSTGLDFIVPGIHRDCSTVTSISSYALKS
jgi:hypothetical protein